MSRKTQIGWISVGVLLCVFSAALTLKLRDSSKAVAGEGEQPAKVAETPPTSYAPPPPGDMPPLLPNKPSEAKLQPPQMIDPAILRTGATEPQEAVPMPAPGPGPLPPPPPVPAPGFQLQPAITPDDLKKPVMPEPVPANTGNPLPPIIVPGNPPALPSPMPVDVKAPSPNWKEPQPLPSKPMPDVKKEIIPVSATAKQDPGEPPMVVPAGPVQIYQVRSKTETLPDIARRTLGSSERAGEIVRLNPDLKTDSVLPLGTTLRLPSDACVQEDVDSVKPLPGLRAKESEKPKVLPLTGTYPCTLDERKILTLPKAIRDQLGNCDTVLVSPGADHCLWITNHAHLERLADRIEHSPARESDVRVFKRLYYAQTEKATLTSEGRIAISDKLAQFAGLSQELVLVGIDEHFELWDAAKWKQYTQEKSAAARAAADE